MPRNGRVFQVTLDAYAMTSSHRFLTPLAVHASLGILKILKSRSTRNLTISHATSGGKTKSARRIFGSEDSAGTGMIPSVSEAAPVSLEPLIIDHTSKEENGTRVSKMKRKSKRKPVIVDKEVTQTSDHQNLINDSGDRTKPARRDRKPVIVDKEVTQTSDHQNVINDSGDRTKPARRDRKKRSRKKKPALQIEPDLETTVHGAEDAFDSIIWCTVHLKVHAELEHNECLYVVGENPELGSWDLSLALPIPPSKEEGYWENTLKIPRGTMLEYKYFTEIADADSLRVARRFGPEIQYFLPWKEGQGAEVEVIRDTWIPAIPANLPLLSWGDRWWEEIDSEDTRGQEAENDEDDTKYYEKELEPQHDEINASSTEEEEPLDAVERGLETPSGVEEWLKKKIRRKALPSEEPWLIESMIMAQRNDALRKKIVDGEANGEGPETSEVEQKEEPVQVEILINSPQCTMQRIAIIEDGRLVELLLEPVNTRVQLGNVYLGVVKQLLPGMTGVFVDIGGFQLALLDITRNQYPYTFPSIRQRIVVSADGSVTNCSGNEGDSDWEGTELESEDDEEDDGEEVEDVDTEEEQGENVYHNEEEDVEDSSPRSRSLHTEVRVGDGMLEGQDIREICSQERSVHPLTRTDSTSRGPITVNFGRKLKKWRKLQEGMLIIVQIKKEALGKKGPRLTAFPNLAGRFWVIVPGARSVGVSRTITGPERKRLRELAKDLQPKGFGLTVRTEALGHGREELEKDLTRLMETWKEILERASAATVAHEHEMEGAVPVLLHRAMGQTLTIVRDFFNDKVHKMVIDSPQCYQEVTSYLQEVAPQLCDRVELYTEKLPIFDSFQIESEIEKFSSKRVNMTNGGYLVMEETEALVSIDVNGGTGMLAQNISQEDAILSVNLAAARQIATELRLRDVGGIIVVDFIDMDDPKREKLVYDEMRKAISRDRSTLSLSEISEFGLMEMTRKRVRPSVTLTISDPCSVCGGAGRVEAHETTLSKIERAVRRLLATKPGQIKSSESTKWPQMTLRVDPFMGEYLKGRKRKRITQLSAALKVWLHIKVALEYSMGYFQVVDRPGSEKRLIGTGQTRSNQQRIGPGLLRKRVWPGKRRRNFGTQVLNKEP